MNLVFCFDQKYLIPMVVAAYSALENYKGTTPISLYLIHPGISVADKKKVEQSLVSDKTHISKKNIHWINVDLKKLKGLKIDRHGTPAVYLRLLLPDILPSTIKKVIYLDCDVVVLGNLEELWQIDMGDKKILAAVDLFEEVGMPMALLNWKELGLDQHAKYFNTGVLVMNLEAWRKEGIGQKVIEYILANPEYIRWWDQDGMNALLHNEWGEIDKTWNWINSPTAQPDDCKIIHYIGQYKPWNAPQQCPYSHYYFSYKGKTAWKEPSRAVIYIAIGNERLCEMATESIFSLRRFYFGKVIVITDMPQAFQSMNHLLGLSLKYVEPTDQSIYQSRMIKTVMNTYSQELFNLFIDVDTVILQSIDSMWDYIEKNDIVAVPESTRHTPPKFTDSVYFNTGVIGWKNTKVSNDFFDVWQTEWKKEKLFDQPSLARAIQQTGIAVGILPQKYHATLNTLDTEPPVIWHYQKPLSNL